jgi:hypothetical protein
VKYKRPLTKSEAQHFHQAMLAVAALEPFLAWRNVGAADLNSLEQDSPTDLVRANRLIDLQATSVACANYLGECVAWWKIYARDREVYFAANSEPFEAARFRASPHFNNVAYWNFEASIQEAVARLDAYREKVAANVQAQSTFSKANGKPVKLARKASFGEVLGAAKVDGNHPVLVRILESYFANPVASTLIAGFAKKLADGLIPSIDFAFPQAEVTGSAAIAPVGPDFLSDELVEQIGPVWAEFVLGTERLYEETLI